MKSFYYSSFPDGVTAEALLKIKCKVGDIIRIIKLDDYCDYYILKENELIKIQGSGYGVVCPHCGEVFVI
jgi:hypothetical protein